jgi:hypothetical protein
MNHFFKPN